jgi:hypothetical protein
MAGASTTRQEKNVAKHKKSLTLILIGLKFARRKEVTAPWQLRRKPLRSRPRRRPRRRPRSGKSIE